ncbi:MAG TPA: TetR/AcrR family transcriptional regulator [Euzebyales bacterium]|nr:TetR/AcrR family transcriptional regulator [Euzebyales bacterium]
MTAAADPQDPFAGRDVPAGEVHPVGGSERGPGRGSAPTAARLRRAAIAAFEDLGWQATRVSDITRQAGVSHGTFYTYYENKVALAEDLIRGSMADLMALASEPWMADDVRGALERVIGGFLDVYQRDRVILRTWLEAARENRRISVRYLEARGVFVDRVSDHVAAVVAASGKADQPPPRAVASALVAMVEHFAYCWAVLGEDHDRDDAVASLVLVWGSTLNEIAGFPVVRPPSD